jgi:outer membrane protein assembly factor BamB
MQRALLSAAILCAGALVAAQFDGPAPLAWRWAGSTTVAPAGSPQTDGETAFVAVGNRVYGIDIDTGNQEWRFPVGEPLQANFRSGLILAEEANLVIAGASDGSIYALDSETGERAWQYVASGRTRGLPVIADSSVVTMLEGDRLLALDLDTGTPIWDQEKLVESGLTAKLSAWDDDVIYFTRDNEIVSLDVLTNQENWIQRFTRLSAVAEATVFEDGLYIANGRFLTVLGAISGGLRWQRNIGEDLVFSPAVNTDGVVVVARTGNVYAFNTVGNQVFGGEIALESRPTAGPTYVEGYVVVPTNNGGVNLIDPLVGEVGWTFVMPPLTENTESSSGSGRAGGPGMGMGPAGGPMGGGGRGNQSNDDDESPDFVRAAGPATVVDNTLLVLARDGSLLSFDDEMGVDLTPPEVDLRFPNAGDQISGRLPLQMVFEVNDLASGIRKDSLQVTVNGEPVVAELDNEGIIRVTFSQRSGNSQGLSDGRAEVVVTLEDWLGNTAIASFSFEIDNTLPPLGFPRRSDDDNNRGPGGQGGPGGMGVGR